MNDNSEVSLFNINKIPKRYWYQMNQNDINTNYRIIKHEQKYEQDYTNMIYEFIEEQINQSIIGDIEENLSTTIKL